ncbi:right-handed parallel beta-helix repeat-containing protein [Nostoc sp. TCL26-01]|uniref:right-handed parallel beta-helix repeat-containing protein n=1 Tax=Nostoc sp. TCL26-01 TaxID=2576904 RepID=UPI0015BBECC3|nr:right-handed parallel beta-helix repeat-containing protein [Nostoc sp. TCL26-01]QLE54721.1 DUF1565 domain-containing protein [Nostoc sp. TCL26-01]
MTTNKNRKALQHYSVIFFLCSFLSTLFLDISWINAKFGQLISANTSKVSAQVPPKVYYVSQYGNNTNPGTIDRPWRNINYAIGASSPVKAGDTILVQPGTYTGLITLGKSGSSTGGKITLKANGKVIIRDPDPINGGFREGVIQAAGKSYWVIDGFRIENTSWAGIALRDASNIIVQNNYTYQTGASGIIVLPEYYYNGGELEVTNSNIKILKNTVERANWRWTSNASIEGTQEALSIWGVDGFEVAYNTLKDGNREGIDIKVGSRNGTVHDNIVTRQALVSGTPNGYRGGPAIYIDGNRAAMYAIDIYNNVVYGNTADAIVIADEDPNIGDVSDICVYNNIIYGNGILGVNGGVGILVGRNVREVEIAHNTLAKNVQAIVIDGASFYGGPRPRDILVRNNIFADSTYRNGYIVDVDNLTIDNNLFTNKFADFYDIGGGLNNLIAFNNTKVPSIGFVNLVGNDFHLTSTSPAINIGSPYISTYLQFDKDGVQRIKSAGASVDVGAYKYVSPI